MTTLHRWQRLLLGTTTAIALAACGGGGGGGSSDDPDPATITVSGTAATGVALASRPVAIDCATGSGSATTGADGRYSAEIEGSLPCALRVTLADGSFLHGVATGSGSTAVAHLTPATELVVAAAAGGSPSAFFDDFDAAAVAKLEAERLARAQSAVIDVLAAAGVDLGAVGDLLSGTLTAGATPGAGNAYDTALDSLATALEDSGTTLPSLRDAVVVATADAVSGTPSSSAAVGLPAELLLQPAAASCSALRSGSYRLIAPTAGAGIAGQTGLLTVDATGLGLTYPSGRTGTLVANGTCRYSTDGGTSDLLVSQAGVLVLRYSGDGGTTHRLAIAFPAQTHTLADLAGTWNMIGLAGDGAGGFTGVASTSTLNGSGATSAASYCRDDDTWSVDDAACTALAAPFESFAAADDGGFTVSGASSGADEARAFGFRPGNGNLMLVVVASDGGIEFRARERSLALPAVGTTSSNWNAYLAGTLLSPASVDERSSTVSRLDAATQSFVRVQSTPGVNNAHEATLFVNRPRDGYTFRQAGQSPAADGTTATVNEFVALGLSGTGVSPLLLPGLKWFDISVQQP